MDLKDRIEKVKPYFLSFNVVAEESAAYAIVKFPQSWTIPDKTALKENFKVEIAPIREGICFATEMSNGTECIFDALDYVIDFNRKVEERKGLMMEKINELKNLFASETLDRLKTLKFTFEAPKKGSKKTASKKAEPAVEPVVIEVPPDSDTYTVALTSEEERKDTTVNEGSLMSLAKSLTGE